VAQPRIVRVDVAPRPYEITVLPGLLSTIGQRLRALHAGPYAVLIFDTNIDTSHRPVVVSSLKDAGYERVTECPVPPGETSKALATVGPLYDGILRAGIDRQTPIIALGGGVVGDMAGFVAATVLRGVPFVQVPTTLLAMVDASVGGKTGINHPVGKNLIGAFHQPIAVLVDPAVLATLPPRELRSGLAECIKHEIIRDPRGFDALETNIGRALALDTDYLAELIAHNVAIKARVVEADPLERGERAHLNFGHTFGHAVETVCGYAYAHGECVALGMVAASHAAVELGMLDDVSRRRIVGLIGAAGLPTRGKGFGIDAVAAAMRFDKKAQAGRLRLVLPDRIGHVVVRDDVPDAVVRGAVASLEG
jgi:3-dehydroquinate synthase